ncbi:hypothetical protein LJC14_05860 [Treponema sp. OttesenSCG-928-L16]|nr:hypothetical protein [Treponema sp. OttesenSCG-928-L16]
MTAFQLYGLYGGRKAASSLAAALLVLICSACAPPPKGICAVPSFPALPEAWEGILGKASWKLEWTNAEGDRKSGTYADGREGVLEMLGLWPSPVLAYPCWPEHKIPPGLFKPAGAIVPFDVRGATVNLSWLGGVEAEFFLMLYAGAGGRRRPEFFNWPRFRALWDDSAVMEALGGDPWNADWQDIAEKTAASGFDRRRMKSGESIELSIPMPAGGLWAGPSPFFTPFFCGEGDTVKLKAGLSVKTCISSAGMIRYTRAGWAWFPGEIGQPP